MRASLGWGLALAAGVSACGGQAVEDDSVSPTPGGHTGTGVTTGGTAGTGGATGGIAEAGVPATGGAPVALPVEIPSRQTVHFELTNASSEVRYVAVDGEYCDPFPITRVDGATRTPLLLEDEYQCGCECPVPPDPAVTRYTAVLPGETRTLDWDARAMVTASIPLDCSQWGTTASRTVAAWQPVASGQYEAKFKVEAAIPPWCTELGAAPNAADLACTSRTYDGFSRCSWTVAATVPFSLPAEGDLTVPVTL